MPHRTDRSQPRRIRCRRARDECALDANSQGYVKYRNRAFDTRLRRHRRCYSSLRFYKPTQVLPFRSDFGHQYSGRCGRLWCDGRLRIRLRSGLDWLQFGMDGGTNKWAATQTNNGSRPQPSERRTRSEDAAGSSHCDDRQRQTENSTSDQFFDPTRSPVRAA